MKLAEAVGVKPTAYIVQPERGFSSKYCPLMKIHALGLTFSQFSNVGYTAFSSGRLGLHCE
jgi:hypothetical protein